MIWITSFSILVPYIRWEEIDNFKVRFEGRKIKIPRFADPKLAQIVILTTLSAVEFTSNFLSVIFCYIWEEGGGKMTELMDEFLRLMISSFPGSGKPAKAKRARTARGWQA